MKENRDQVKTSSKSDKPKVRESQPTSNVLRSNHQSIIIAKL